MLYIFRITVLLFVYCCTKYLLSCITQNPISLTPNCSAFCHHYCSFMTFPRSYTKLCLGWVVFFGFHCTLWCCLHHINVLKHQNMPSAMVYCDCLLFVYAADVTELHLVTKACLQVESLSANSMLSLPSFDHGEGMCMGNCIHSPSSAKCCISTL